MAITKTWTRLTAVPLILGAVLALTVACGSSDQQTASQPTSTAANAPTTTPQPLATTDQNDTGQQNAIRSVLAAGQVEVPAAGSFDDPGFHFAISEISSVPSETPGSGTLVLTLRDASRPNGVCSQDHPLSGCLTVDWSDFEGRTRVPPGGVLENSITLQIVSGPKTFYLTERDGLSEQRPPYSPG